MCESSSGALIYLGTAAVNGRVEERFELIPVGSRMKGTFL